MTSLTRYAIAAAIVLCCAGSLAPAQTQTKTPKKGSVAGKVTIKGKAAPGIVVGMRVSQPTSQFEPLFKATTDQEGNYLITNVPGGSYQAAPVAPAFVVSDANNLREQTVIMTEGEAVEGIDFALVRGGVITGKLTDAEGRAVIEQRVSLIAADPPNPRGRIYQVAGVQTDDRGIYRIFGIAAGRYKVAVGQGEGNYINASGRALYKQTFYPSVTDTAKAVVVEVTEGSEAANIDITLGSATQTFAASGIVVDGENDQPLANARFAMQLIIDETHQRDSHVYTSATSNSHGEFIIEGLSPGKYTISLAAQLDSNLRAKAVPFEIIDQHVTRLVIKTVKGSSLAGSVVLENTDNEAAFAKLIRLQVLGYVQHEGPGDNFSHAATINSDGTFQFTGLESGTAHLSVWSQDRNLLKGFYVSRVERDTIVQSRGLEIKTGDHITGVRVVVGYGNATVQGVVKLENGTLSAGARLFVRVTKVGETASNSRPPQIDGRGHFLVEGLPGGVYDFIVTVFTPGEVGPQPSAKQQVNVPDGVVTEVTIALDLKQNPGPPKP